MSLNWSIENVKDHKSVCWLPTDETDEDGKPLFKLNPVTEAIIFSTMGVGIGRITEDNAGEFYARLFVTERVHGAMLVKQGEPQYLTDEDVRAHIGLTCNVAYESREAWAQKMFIGHGDGLISYGEKLAPEDDDTIHERIDALRAEADRLYDAGKYEAGDLKASEAERLERFDDSVLTERARYFRSKQNKAVEA